MIKETGSRTRLVHLGALLLAGSVPLALTACSSPSPSPSPSPTQSVSPTDSPTNSPSPTDSPTESPSPTDSPTNSPSPTDSPTNSPSPTDSPTNSPSPTDSPTGSVSPSPTGTVLGIGVLYSPTTVKAWDKISITGQTDPSLAGKKAYILKINDGVTNVIDTGSPVSSNGTIRTWAKLGRTGQLRLIVPAVPVTAGPLPFGTPLLAQSSTFTVTVTP